MAKWVTAASSATSAPRIDVALAATLIVATFLAQTTHGFRPIEASSREGGRKLFGGYRITPKHCRGTKTLPVTDPRAHGPTICMFNHECAQRNGEVVGACMDGFLFGACCQIPSNHEIESTLINDAQNAYFQQHQQQKVHQQQQAVSNPAAALSYEAYGGESLQQQSVEEADSTNNGGYGGQLQTQSHPEVNEPENIDKVFQQLDTSNNYPSPSISSINYQSSSVASVSGSNSYAVTSPSTASHYLAEDELQPVSAANDLENIDKVYQQLDSGNNYPSPPSTYQQHDQQQEDQQQQQEQEPQPEETSYQQVASSSNNYEAPSVYQTPSTYQTPTAFPEPASSPSTTSSSDDSVQQQDEKDTSSSQDSTESAQTSASQEQDADEEMEAEPSPAPIEVAAPVAPNPPPTVHVPKDKVKISSPSSPPLNDEFVMQVISTLAPGHEDDHIAFTTEVPMKISSSLVHDQASSESNSFEEEPATATQQPARPTTTTTTTTTTTAKPMKKKPAMQNQQQQHQQSQKHQQTQHQHQQTQHQQTQHDQQTHQTQQQPQHHHQQTQQHQSSNQHHHNHLQLDGAEFTHSGITHPGADADLVEDDLQFSTGYGPQPVYVESPAKDHAQAPAPEDKYVLVQTITNEQLNKKTPPAPAPSSTAGSPTTASSITTHVDSIESIILQLNNTNHGPTYNVVGQQQQPTPSYGANDDEDSAFYDAASSSTPQASSSSYQEVETKRPEDFYAQAPVVSYDTVSSDEKDQEEDEEEEEASNAYLQNEYPSARPPPVSHSSAPAPEQSYEGEAEVLEDHTVPESNYNDVVSSGHPTSDFNKMPAVGIAYPVDMSYFEGEEDANVVQDGEEQSAYGQPALPSPAPTTTSTTSTTTTTTTTTQKAPSHAYQTEPQPLPTYTRLPLVTESRPVASYIGVITAQNFNQLHQPSASVYSQLPEEVSVSSHTTKVQSEEYVSSPSASSSYPTAAPAPERLTTVSYVDSPAPTPSAVYISSTSTPLATRPQYGSPSTARPVLVTAASSAKPKPKPKPSKRPTKRPASANTNTKKTSSKPAGTKKPVAQPSISYNQEQPASNSHHQERPASPYNPDPVHTKRPSSTSSSSSSSSGSYQDSQPSNSYNQEPVYTKKPVNTYNQEKPSNSYNQKKPVNSYNQEKPSNHNQDQPSNSYNQEPVQTKRPSSSGGYQDPQPSAGSYNQEQPSISYNQEQPSNSYNQKQPSNSYNQEKPSNSYNQQPSNSYNQEQPIVTKKPSSSSHSKRPTAQPSQSAYGSNQHQQHVKQPSAGAYGQQDKPDPPHASSAPHPANTYNQNQELLVTASKRPTTTTSNTRKPAVHKKPVFQPKPISTSYVTGPTSPRPPTTFGYHDDEVPPLIVADDKLDSFVHSTAEAVAAQSPGYQSTYAAPVYVSSVTPLSVQHPVSSISSNNYNTHKKPGFVKVQATVRPPVPTVLITPKPTVGNLATVSSWATQHDAYPQTTPSAGFGSTSYVYSPVVTRRPEFAANTPSYVGLPSAVTSNDFDDPGYYGAQNTHPAFAQATTEATYGVPSDDRPAFPGYYGPTPTYPAFQVPGEKVGAPEAEEEAFNSPNDFVNFPPVRNPNLNMSATSSAVTSDLELSTPAFVEDVVLKDKMNTLVHKIVESLQGNFDALADMIDEANSTAPAHTYSVGVKPAASSVTSTSGTRKPTRKPTRVTSASTSAKPKPRPTTKRPTATRVSTKPPAKRPSTVVTTRRPATATSVRRTTTTTRRPATRKPTKRTTTTTTTAAAPVDDELIDEEDEEDVNPSENEIDQTETISGGAGGGGGRKLQCGVRPHVKSGRIVGGKGSTFGAFPWQVLVRESTWLGLFTKNKCGGVLITHRYVITAAHCQPGFLASLVAVMGEYDISGDLESKRAVTKNVKRVIVHRQYDPATFENDLALLELESPVQFDTHIVPICMPSDTADFTGRMATVTGWGRLKYGGGVPSVLQEVQVPIIENSVCQEMFHTAGHNKKILGSFLCAGYANGQKDSCEGDSGGPLVLQRPDGRYELAGTVSHGIKCAAPYLPGVYMRTTFYKPWLRSITGVK